MLTALKCPFNLHELLMFCEEKKKNYTKVEDLLNKYKLGDILSHLYKVGIIGNTGQKVRYSFRGDDELVIENSMKSCTTVPRVFVDQKTNAAARPKGAARLCIRAVSEGCERGGPCRSSDDEVLGAGLRRSER